MKDKDMVHIGTSGWHYQHWKGPFYPSDINDRKMLDYYQTHFKTAEINNTFYQLPAAKTLVEWRESVPEDFIFSVKASRYITHMKKLKDPREPVNNFLARIEALNPKLGPILFQLPPRWGCNPQRLTNFLEVLPDDKAYIFEFRDSSWFNDQVYRALEEKACAFCIYDLDRELSPKVVTADFIYIRLHGPQAPYQGQYSDGTLAGWAKDFDKWTEKGKEIYCYFDNDQAGYAASDALKLKKMIDQG